jgi:hypothetical protein
MLTTTRTPPQLQLDRALQDAFVRAEFDRLLAFACWCAGNTIEVSSPAPWKAALALARLRANGHIAPDAFRARAKALKADLPVAASVVGLQHRLPRAVTLLAVAAALDPGPLAAALGASSHQRMHARLLARQSGGESRVPKEVAVVDADRSTCPDSAGDSPNVAETQCAQWQWAVWESMAQV